MDMLADGNLNSLLNVIQIPIYNSLRDKNKVSNFEIINSIDLNVTNFNKYFPIISSILKNNDNYNEDLLYDFLEIRSMSTYLFDILEKLVETFFLEINSFLEKIYDSLLFVDKLLDDFHKILNIKNDYINGKKNLKEYNEAYTRYKLRLEQDINIFYDKYYENNEKEGVDILKEIMPLKYVKKNEYKKHMLWY